MGYKAPRPVVAMVRARSGGRCECCGECGREAHSDGCGGVTGDGTIALDTAHVDQDRRNNDPANVRAWCRSCHRRHDQRWRQKRRSLRDLRAREAAGQLVLPGAAPATGIATDGVEASE